MKLIQSGKYSLVHYDPEQDWFIKTFQPKRFDKLRYALRIRPYPGYNFALIARKLAALKVATPVIIESRRYSVTTKNVHGLPLRDLILGSAELQQQYLDILVSYYRNDIHCRGLHTGNFLVSDGHLVAIDLDAYKAPRFFKYSKREFLDCLKRSLQGDEAFLFDRLLVRLQLDTTYRPLP